MLLLKCWKITNKICQNLAEEGIRKTICQTKDFSQFQKRIFLYVIQTWFEKQIITYSLPDNIENFRLKNIDVDTIIYNFTSKRNPYLIF